MSCDKVKVFKEIIESMEDCIVELKDYKNQHTKECAKVSCEDKAIIELRNELSKSNVHQALKERRRILVFSDR